MHTTASSRAPGPHQRRPARATHRVLQLVLGIALCVVGTAAATAAEQGSAASLRASYAKHRADIDSRKFGEPLHLASQQTSTTLQGDIHALVDHPFEKVRASLAALENWCEILILHPNVKNCSTKAAQADQPRSLAVTLGRAEVPVSFSYQAVTSTTDYLDVRLGTPTGPFGTTDYRIRLEAAPMGQQTILHLSYSHGYGVRAKLAMQAYFSTLGRGKVGFTVVGKDAEGKPLYVSDLRGGLERNALRYYASIESYLDALAAPRQQQVEQRLRHWYAYTERHPLQLQEEPGYLDLKRKEAQRVQAQGPRGA